VWLITQEYINLSKKLISLVYSGVAPGVAPVLMLLRPAALGCVEAPDLCCVKNYAA